MFAASNDGSIEPEIQGDSFFFFGPPFLRLRLRSAIAAKESELD